MALQGAGASDLIHCLLDLVDYESHLKKLEDGQARWENVQELINFAAQFERERNGITKPAQPPMPMNVLSTDQEIINLVGDDKDVVPTTPYVQAIFVG